MNIVDYVNYKMSQVIGLLLVAFIALLVVYAVLRKRSTEFQASMAAFAAIAVLVLLVGVIIIKAYYVMNFGTVLTGAQVVIDKFQINTS